MLYIKIDYGGRLHAQPPQLYTMLQIHEMDLTIIGFDMLNIDKMTENEDSYLCVTYIHK